MNQDAVSQALFLVLFGLLGLAWALALAESLRGSEAAGRWSRRLIVFSLLWNLAALTHRGFSAGHAPWANQYESATMVAFGVVASYYLFSRKHPVKGLGLLVLPAAMVVIAAASLLPGEYKKMNPLMPALQSYWLTIHVSLMLLSYGAFATTFGLSLMYLVKDGAWTRQTTWIALPLAGAAGGAFFAYVHKSAGSEFWAWLMAALKFSEIYGDQAKVYALLAGAGLLISAAAAGTLNLLPSRLMSLLPERDVLDELNYQSVALGFPMLTLGIILGAFWGHVAWGRYWAWDPKETWAFISFLIFAFYLHMRIFAGWQGRRTAWIGLLGAGSIVFTYWGVNFLLSGLHAYAKGT